MAGSGVVTVKGEKRSDFGCVSNPVWAGIADELYVEHEREFKNDSQGFWPKQLEAWNCC